MIQPLISIVVPVYNAEKQLPQMLDSIIRQSYETWETILVNDGSTDQSEQIIRQYIKKDSRFRYFSQSNAGPSVARNLGIKQSQGQYLSFIDADDWVCSTYLEKLIEPMLAYDVDLVCAGYFEVNPKFPQGLKLHDFQSSFFQKNIDKQAYQSNLFNGVSGVLWAKLFKKEIFQQNNITLHPELRLSEDLIAVLEYSKYIGSVYIIPDSIYFYNRLEEDGLSSNLSIEKYKNLDIFLSELDKFQNELDFLNLEEIKNKRKYSLMIQLLKANLDTKAEFYKTAEFLVKKESSQPLNNLPSNKINKYILNSLFNQKFFNSYIILKAYQVLKQIKNG